MKKNTKIIIVSLIAVFLIFRLTIFILLTNIIEDSKPILINALSNKLGREIIIKHIKVNFLGGIYLSDLEVRTFGNDDPLEHFTVKRLVTHLSFLNLLKAKRQKNYLNFFRKISFQGANIKLRSFGQTLSNIKGRLIVTNGDFSVDHLKLPLGETELVCKGWIRNFNRDPVVDLNIETRNLKAEDLLIFYPKLEFLKLAARGRFSGHLCGRFDDMEASGEIFFSNVSLETIQLSQLTANFFYADGCVNFTSLQSKISKGMIEGDMKITEIFSQPDLKGTIRIRELQTPLGDCSGKLSLTGNLSEPRVTGTFDIIRKKRKISLEKIDCHLRFLSNAIYCKNGEVLLPEVGKVLWQGEVQDNLAYGFYFYLPPLRSQNLSFYLKKWPDLPGIFKVEGKITGFIGAPEANYEGKLTWDSFGNVKAINWKVRGDKNLIKIKHISLGEGINITGSIRPQPYFMQLLIDLNNFNLGSASLNGQIALKGNEENLLLEKSVLSSEIFECSIKGEKKGEKVELKATLELKKIPSSANLSLAGNIVSSGFTGKLLVSPIVIQGGVYSPIAGLIKINSEKIEIEKLRWLDAYFLEGEVNFSPLGLYLKLLLEEANIVPVLLFSSTFSEEDNFGIASGEIECKGDWPNVAVKGTVELNDSKINGKNIEYAKFQVEGTNPYFILKESPVILDGTTLICQGPIDLTKPGKAKFEGVKYVLDENQMVWKGWKIDKEEEKNELSLTKEVDGGFSVRLRAPTVSDAEGDLAKEPGPEVELEYTIKGKEKLKLRIDEDDDFIGIEHEIKF